MSRTVPKYSLIADQLLREIQAGKLPVGSLLPTESELMRAYGVSRHTVRNAVQDLKSRGIAASRQGQGSRVIADGPASGFVERIQSISELVAFAQETRRELVSQEFVDADEALAGKFECATGRRLLKVKMIRHSVDPGAKPIAFLIFYMDALFETAIEAFESQARSAAEIIREQFGYDIGSVTQTVWADALTEEAATVLGEEPGGPALVIERDYAVSPDRAPHMTVSSVCAARNVKVVSRFTSPNRKT